MGTGEKLERASRVLRQPPQSWASGAPIRARYDESLEFLLVEAVRSLFRERGLELCITLTWQPWLDRDSRALPVARTAWHEAVNRGFHMLWWINPAARIFYVLHSDLENHLPGLSSSLPAVIRLLSEELGVTHPLRAVRLAVEALGLQLPEQSESLPQGPNSRA